MFLQAHSPKILLLIITGLPAFYLRAQKNQPIPTFNEVYMMPSDMVIEGTVTEVSFFTDTSSQLHMHYYGEETVADISTIGFAKYQIRVHKVFKGDPVSYITLIMPDYNYTYSFDGGRTFSRRSFRITNLYMNFTRVFFLQRAPGEPAGSNIYYATLDKYREGVHYLNNINQITETYLRIRDGNDLRTFETLEEFYRYLESATRRKRTDLTHVKFVLNNSPEKVNEYLKVNFFEGKKLKPDTMSYETLGRMLQTRQINQLNKDSFVVDVPVKKEAMKKRK